MGACLQLPPSTGKKGLALLLEDRLKQLDGNSTVVTQGFQRPKAVSGGLVWPVSASQTLSFSEYQCLCQL